MFPLSAPSQVILMSFDTWSHEETDQMLIFLFRITGCIIQAAFVHEFNVFDMFAILANSTRMPP